MSKTYHVLAGGYFAQNWSNTGLITINDDWSNVPSIEGFLGQDITTSTGTDPQTLLTDSALPNDLDVIANQNNPDVLAQGGVAEFDGIANPSIALNGSGTADAPHIIIYLDTTGMHDIRVRYTTRDLDASTDDALSQVELQYRIGESGNWTNVPGAFVSDATSPSSAFDSHPVNVILPAAAENQAKVQLRIITANAAGNDEWIGIDDIIVSSLSNSPTVIRNDQISVLQDTAFVADAGHGVLANDTQSTELSLVADWKKSASGGQVSFRTDGGYAYVSAPGFVGTDTFQYTVVDSLQNVVGTGTLTVDVAATALRPFVSVGDQLGTRHQVTSGFGQVGNGVVTSPFTPVALAGGGYVVAVSYLNQAPGLIVEVRTYDANHNLLSVFDPGSFITSTTITALTDGDYAMTYAIRDGNLSTTGTLTNYVRFFDANGHSLSGQISLDVAGRLDGISAVSALPGGGFATLQTGDPGTGQKFYIQSFDANGATDGTQYTIDDPAKNATILPNGQIVVPRITGDVHLQRYDLHGSPIGDEIVAPSDALGIIGARIVARPDGGFILRYNTLVTHNGGPSGHHDVQRTHVQAYDADGHLIATQPTEDLVFTSLFGDPLTVSILTPLVHGGYVVSWRGVIDSNEQELVQAYDSHANPVGAPIEFTSLTEVGAQRPLTYALPADGFAVTLQTADPTKHNAWIYDDNGSLIGEVRLHDAADGTTDSTITFTKLPNGDTVVMVSSFGSIGNPTDAITTQTIRFDTAVPAIQTGEAVKDDAAIVPVKIYIPDPDGSEIVQSIEVSGVPAGWTLDYHGATATLNGGVWTITGAQIAKGGDIDLHLAAPNGTTGTAHLSVVVHTIDTDNGSQNQSFPAGFDVTLSPALPFQYAGTADSGPHGGGYQVAGIGDFNHDGTSDVLWRNPTTGAVEDWRMKDGHWDATINLGSHGTGWTVAAVGDFNGDGTSDILWREATTGKLDAWIMKNGQWSRSQDLGSHGADWQVLAAADFNSDHTSDILFRNTTTGAVDEWQMKDGNWNKSIGLGSYSTASNFAGAGDLNHDGAADILWRNPTTGAVDEWQMVNGNWSKSISLGSFNTAYDPVAVADFNGNGSNDVLFRNPTTGQVEGWVMSNGQWAGSVSLGSFNPAWQLAGTGDFNHAAGADALWFNPATGQTNLWLLNAV